jgi:hypothetical protein
MHGENLKQREARKRGKAFLEGKVAAGDVETPAAKAERERQWRISTAPEARNICPECQAEAGRKCQTPGYQDSVRAEFHRARKELYAAQEADRRKLEDWNRTYQKGGSDGAI